MDIAREQLLSELESHISRCVQTMRQIATVDHEQFQENMELWLENLETDLRLIRRLSEELDLVEKQRGQS